MTTDEFAAAVARMRVPGVPAKVVQVVAQLATAPEGDLVYYIEFFQVSDAAAASARLSLPAPAVTSAAAAPLLRSLTSWLTLLSTAVCCIIVCSDLTENPTSLGPTSCSARLSRRRCRRKRRPCAGVRLAGEARLSGAGASS